MLDASSKCNPIIRSSDTMHYDKDEYIQPNISIHVGIVCPSSAMSDDIN